MKNKKGSISISINMIVVVVLAFVMLGLMLGVGRNIMNMAGSGAETILGTTEADILNELIRSDDPLYFSAREYDVNFGKRVTLNFGVKNVDPSTRNLHVEIEYIDSSSAQQTTQDVVPSREVTEEYGAFFWVRIPDQFGPGEGKVWDVQYRAPSGTRDTFAFRFKLMEGTNTVASQVIFFNII